MSVEFLASLNLVFLLSTYFALESSLVIFVLIPEFRITNAALDMPLQGLCRVDLVTMLTRLEFRWLPLQLPLL